MVESCYGILIDILYAENKLLNFQSSSDIASVSYARFSVLRGCIKSMLEFIMSTCIDRTIRDHSGRLLHKTNENCKYYVSKGFYWYKSHFLRKWRVENVDHEMDL